MLKTAVLGVSGFVLSVVVVLGSLFWFPDVARAAAPVQPFPWLPSSFQAGTSSAPPTLPPGASEAEWEEWRLRDREYRRTLIDAARTRSYTPQTAPQPVAPPKAPTRGVGGGPLGLVLWAPLLVEGGLQIIAMSAEGQALGIDSTVEGIICNGVGSTTDPFTAWLYGTHNCYVEVPEPNTDVPEGLFFSTGATFTWTTGTENVPFGGTFAVSHFCGQSGALPAGQVYSVFLESAHPSNGSLLQGWNDFALDTSSNPGRPGCSGPPASWRGSWRQGANTSVVTWAPRPLKYAIRVASNGAVIEEAAQADQDPTRQARCRVEWSDGSVTFADGSAYQESTGLPSSSSTLGCEEAYAQRPGTATPERIRIESEDEGGAITEIADMPVPAEANQPKPAEGLKLLKLVGADWRSCMTWEVGCGDWWEESAEGASTDKYRCVFGGEPVALSECGVYRYTFADPDNLRIFDPESQQEFSWGTGNDPFVTPGTGNAVTGAGACSPSWSWNPVDWVLNPVKCAFIPSSASVQAAVGRVQDSWDETWPVKAMEAGTTALAALQTLDLSGCAGPHIYWEISWPVPMVWDSHPFNACGPPYDFLALVSRVVMSLLVIGWTVWGLTRRVGAVVSSPGVGPS